MDTPCWMLGLVLPRKAKGPHAMNPGDRVALIWFIIAICVVVLIVAAAVGFHHLQTWLDVRRTRRIHKRPPGDV